MSMDHVLSTALAQPDSPFIEGTRIQYAWDSVSLTSILACPRRYQYQILWGLTPNSPGFAIALVFGILFHKGLEWYHKSRAGYTDEGGDYHSPLNHKAAVQAAITDILKSDATCSLPTAERIIEMAEERDEEDDGIDYRNSKIRTRYYLIRALVWYLEQYKDDPCATVLLPSGAPAVELSFRVPLGIDVLGVPLLLCGHIDRAITFNDRLYVSDYKTSKSLTRQFFRMFDLSHQMTGYTLAGKIILEEETRGCMIDGVALQVGSVKFGRAFTDRSQGQVAEYIELLSYASQMAVRFFETNSYPMNTASCYFCEFKDVCRQPPEYRERYIAQHYSRKPGWNPLENR